MNVSSHEREHVTAQLNLVTQTQLVSGLLHRVRKVPDVRILTLSNQARTPEQVAWFLEHDKWEDDVVSSCGVDYCCSHIRLAGQPEDLTVPATEPISEAQLLGMVERQSVTLADLYRKARSRGVISARSDYR